MLGSELGVKSSGRLRISDIEMLIRDPNMAVLKSADKLTAKTRHIGHVLLNHDYHDLLPCANYHGS